MAVDASAFVIIGENIHCTRKLRRGGKRVRMLPDGTEVVVFAGPDGQERTMPIPARIRQGQSYASGMVLHVAAAVTLGIDGQPNERQIGREYVQWLARQQLDHGAMFLDVNVDEISPDIDLRNQAMRWAVQTVQAVSDKPLSIDSSEVATLQAGLEVYDAAKAGPAMLNSASLERPAAIELARQHNCPTVVMSSSPSGMPSDSRQRMDNIRQMIELCRQAGLGISQLYVDPLIFPASASPETPAAVLETIRQVRAEFGQDIHIAGGHSNVSFGLPMRRVLNAVWLRLAIEAGADSGLIDPITCHPNDIARLDPTSQTFRMARAGFLGQDPYFMDFIEAARSGRLHDPFASR